MIAFSSIMLYQLNPEKTGQAQIKPSFTKVSDGKPSFTKVSDQAIFH
jgi:hypothetical protein